MKYSTARVGMSLNFGELNIYVDIYKNNIKKIVKDLFY